MSWTEDVQWDLDSIVAGGPLGAAFLARAEALERQVELLVSAADALGDVDEDPAYAAVLPHFMAVREQVVELHMFILCYASTHVDEPAAWRAEARVSAISSRMDRAMTNPTDRISRASEESYRVLCSRPELADMIPFFDDMRRGAHLLLPAGEQALFAELYEDSLGAWGRLYERVAGRVVVPVGDEKLSTSQALNRMDDPDPNMRAAVMKGLEEGWAPHLELCGEMLTHIYGIRRQVNLRLGVDELEQPLCANRITRLTLTALLDACRAARPLISRYLAAKARLIGREKLDWADLRAPVGRLGRSFGYPETQRFIVEQFRTFSADMAEFARDAFQARWVEAEDRRGKRPGAFCAPMPSSRESRVFMTFGGRMNSVITLAHELGHAYHNKVILHLNPALRGITSSLAETASTFAETLVRSAMLQSATDEGEQLAILDQELGDATSFLANIPVRFDFERSLHALRAQGDLDPDALSARMVELQREWYGESLGRANPVFWADKLHFYIPDTPFYNFPYTFGYLFSSLVNIRATREGSRWAQGYIDLLKDTGVGPAEQLASRHLGVDLEDAATWQPVLERLEQRLTLYERLAG